MTPVSVFTVQRRDNLSKAEDVLYESEGLTIGSHTSCSIVLDDKEVSQIHAQIRQIDGRFWVFNLSNEHETRVNDAPVNSALLQDDDKVCIGPYTLTVQYNGSGLSVIVYGKDQVRSGTLIDSRSIDSRSDELADNPGALDIYWQARQGSKGKITAASKLRPKSDRKIGMAQFSWKPTLDLRRFNSSPYIIWAAIVGVVGLIVLFVYQDGFSPGATSLPHSLKGSSLAPLQSPIALRPAANSCAECHSVTDSMQSRCSSCHSTQERDFSLTGAHLGAGITCMTCHKEHRGAEVRSLLPDNAVCVSCHSGSAGTDARAAVPHGPPADYPKTNGEWNWKGLSGLQANAAFHSAHSFWEHNCVYCHETEQGQARFIEAPRAACQTCHTVSVATKGLEAVGPNCVTCHELHPGLKKRDATALASSLSGGQDNAEFKPGSFVPAKKGIDDLISEKRSGGDGFSNLGVVLGYGVGGLLAILFISILGIAIAAQRQRSHLGVKPEEEVKAKPEILLAMIGEYSTVNEGAMLSGLYQKSKGAEPDFPHPVINPLTCIGCHACVEACPHDVLAMVNGIAVALAIDQCLEDTSCQVECPTNPKSCVVINTNKIIPTRKAPVRNQQLMTNVEGVYLIGDVSGVPLIKNAINEGGQAIEYIIEELQRKKAAPEAEYDVAIIGIGPAGLSAAVIAKQRGLSYVAIEQDRVVATIQQTYPTGKFVFYKPDTVETRGGIPLPGVGGSKEEMLKGWLDAMYSNNVVINEEESCKDIKHKDGVFVVSTERGRFKERMTYKARKVIIAIGNRGTPMKLRVPGEDLRVMVTPEPRMARFCPVCGNSREGEQKLCVACGAQIPLKTQAPYETGKVQYKLTDPDDYVGKNCVVVGASNPSIEAAVELTGFKREGGNITFTRTNEVVLLLRSSFHPDLTLRNKMNVYDCIDAGKIKAFFRTEIKEITENEVILMDVRAKEEKARIKNDFVFALIGGEKPTKFLESVGVKIG